MAEACMNLSGTISTNCSALEFPCRLHFFSFRAKLFRKKLCFKGKSKISLIEHLCPEMHAMAKMAKLAKNRQLLAV